MRRKTTKRERAAALIAGKKFYSTGRPCRNAHIAMRLTVNGRCVKCQSENSSMPHIQAQKRHYTRLKSYGLEAEQFQAMMAEQHGRCAICSKLFGTGRSDCPNIDHNHVTGKVRGLLCGSCNAGLGHFKDEETRLRRAIEYLKKHKAKIFLSSLPNETHIESD